MIHLHKDLYLTADPSQFILFTKKIGKEGKSKGKEIISDKKYFPTINLLLVVVFEKMLFEDLAEEEMETHLFLRKRFKQLSNITKDLSDKIGNAKNLYLKMSSENVESLDN